MTVKTATMKSWARKSLTLNDPLRDMILSEAETLPNDEFLIVAKRWFRIVDRRS